MNFVTLNLFPARRRSYPRMFTIATNYRQKVSILLVLLSTFASAQVPQALKRPDAIINVREHTTGAEYVQITMVNGDYPAELLRAQCEEIGKLLNSSVRGLTVQSTSLSDVKKNLAFMRADFAVDHVMEDGLLRIEPLIKPFVGVKEPFTIGTIQIIFDKYVPNPANLQKFQIPGVLNASAAVLPNGLGLEYRINFESQDPSLVKFPERYEPERPSPKEATPEQPRISQNMLIALFVIAGLALGALVYFAMVRTTSSNRR